MSALFILVPTSLVLGFIGLCCFIWSLRTKQYEDLDGAAERLLLDDPLDRPAAGRAENRVVGRDEASPVAPSRPLLIDGSPHPTSLPPALPSRSDG